MGVRKAACHWEGTTHHPSENAKKKKKEQKTVIHLYVLKHLGVKKPSLNV